MLAVGSPTVRLFYPTFTIDVMWTMEAFFRQAIGNVRQGTETPLPGLSYVQYYINAEYHSVYNRTVGLSHFHSAISCVHVHPHVESFICPI